MVCAIHPASGHTSARWRTREKVDEKVDELMEAFGGDRSVPGRGRQAGSLEPKVPATMPAELPDPGLPLDYVSDLTTTEDRPVLPDSGASRARSSAGFLLDGGLRSGSSSFWQPAVRSSPRGMLRPRLTARVGRMRNSCQRAGR